MTDEKYQNLISVIEDKIASFRDFCTIPTWQFNLGNNAGNNGQEVELPHTWSSAEGRGWFKYNLDLPAAFNNIPLKNSSVELTFLCPIGTTVYVNDEEVYHEPYWSDGRPFPIQITDQLSSSEQFQITLETKAGDGFGLFLNAALRIEALEDKLFRLQLFKEQIKFCKYIQENNNEVDHEDALQKAVGLLDIEALSSNDWQSWQQSTAKAITKLMVFQEQAQAYETNLIAHAHIDMNWLWPWPETVKVCQRDFSTVDKLMEKYPQFHFSQSQASTYKAVEDYHPEIFETIKQRVNEGRWDITASTWVEGDLNTALGETLVRQILYTRQYIEEKFGVVPEICWEPDTFGHPASYPQILKKSGVDYYYFCRAGKGQPIFWWEGLDGSRVLAYNDAYGYGGEIDPENITDSCKLLQDENDLKLGLWVYGVGDHGGGATARDIKRAQVIDDTPLLPAATPSSTPQFYDKLKAADKNYPVIKDELNTVFEGCYSSHADIKKLNRDGENLLLTAETIAAVAELAGSNFNYPMEEFTDAWKQQCFHQFHDIICGCSIGSTYEEAAENLLPVQKKIEDLTEEAVADLAANVDTGSGNNKIAVFNQLAWNRTDVVRIALDEFEVEKDNIDNYYLEDDQDRCRPLQIMDNNVIFTAENMPAAGCKVYTLKPKKENTSVTSDLKVDEENNIMENKFYKVKINPESGAIDSLIMKDSGKNIAISQTGWGAERKINAGMLNRFKVYHEQPHPMSAWNIGDITRVDSLIKDAEVKLKESGPVCATIEINHSFLNSSITQQICLYSDLKRLDFNTEVDWQEQGKDKEDAPMLKTTFTPSLDETVVNYEIPYGVIKRNADGTEKPALRWADISDDNYGVTVINDYKYGYHAQGNTLALTLLRSSYEPDNKPDQGIHNFTYALYPHEGGWQKAKSKQQGLNFNQPLLAAVTDGHQGSIKPGEATISIRPENIFVSAVKKAEKQPQASEQTALIIRLVESHGQPAAANLSLFWDIIEAEEVNLLEQGNEPVEISDTGINIHLDAFEIKSLRLVVNN